MDTSINNDNNSELMPITKEYITSRAKHKLVIFAISLIIFIMVCVVVVNILNFCFLMPVNAFDDTPVKVTIEQNASLSSIADLLKEKDLIKNAMMFRLMVTYYNQGSLFKAGDYVFNKTMNPRQIMYMIAAGEATPRVLTITVIEGYNVDQEASSLANEKIIDGTETFLDIAKNGGDFLGYEFLEDVPESKMINRKYALEGYLFPDTYEIYLGSSEEEIMAKQIDKFNTVFGKEYRTRAEEIGLTVDEVVTLASIVQKEGNDSEFAKVAAVFHNRLDKDMKLQACSTVQYANGIKRMKLTDNDLSTPSLYNTYKYTGIPVGPICNPSEAAIKAVLYPDQDYIDEGYLYFCSKDPYEGGLAFSKTLSEHEANVAKYEPLWIQYDKEKGY